MLLNFIDRVGELNPQLFRELKGRLKGFNFIISIGSSLLLQLIVFLFQFREFPDEYYYFGGTYCTLGKVYQQQEQALDQQQNLLSQKIANYQQIKLADLSIIPNLEAQLNQVKTELNNLRSYLVQNVCPLDKIDWQLWWRDHWEYTFLTLSVILIFSLLVGGTYLLISDLAKEEQRGTLNFIRLSPQTATSILTGKILGVPSLIYLFVLTAIPLHFWAGHSAKIASSYILSYYAVLVGSCVFFYSAALIFGLVSRWFSSFQPWLGSGAVLVFLLMTMAMVSSYGEFNNLLTWIRFFAPWDITNYLFPNLFRSYQDSSINKLEFFFLPIGKSFITLVGFHLVNYGICSYGIWQAMKRCFRNADSTILSKGQSYLFVGFAQIMFLGLTIPGVDDKYNLGMIFLSSLFNFVLVLALTLILSPHRQTIQDWARYRHQNHRNKSLLQDLVFGEKSPAIVAIAINLLIAIIPTMIWILFSPDNFYNGNMDKSKVILAMILALSLMLIYATIAQLMLLMKNPKRYVWAAGTMGVAMFLPSIMLSVLGITPYKNPTLWLFSTFPWAAIEYAEITTIFMALLADFTVVALLNLQLNRKIVILGESATKALLAGR
ncbi:ABC transporter permease [Dolichospermum planctonicum CS-1226]|uniref:ABC transporter permease n=1 Tax=Dolichospermum planctonicum CS-1226 TaxID=3021751 RepID=A0ABT5AG87_9CYAN|nr:ABC transporter permease [Dolichospermum planctonicum]MDB9536295.1 ABC transporter permease [Dolichospermum planctonicum CS-1226]